MNKTAVKRFQKIFESQKHQILFNDKVLREDFAINEDDKPDEVDQATTDIEQSMRMRLRNRELLYLRKIDEALRRIDDGIFGECENCGDDIEVKRLQARPTATLCLLCKEEEERNEVLTANGLRHKSLGETFSKKTG